MQCFIKEKGTFIFVVVSLVLLALIFSLTTRTVTNVSAVEAEGLGVYWNPTCIDKVSSIEWGTLEPGSVKNIRVYIRNEADEPQFLSLSTINWNPSKAYDYITLRWNYDGRRIDLGEVLQIELRLSVYYYVEGISNFSFDILIAGSRNLQGDLNGDGVVDSTDHGIFGIAWASTVGEANYIPEADVNSDGTVDSTDLGLLGLNW